jgi:hypothetical protein
MAALGAAEARVGRLWCTQRSGGEQMSLRIFSSLCLGMSLFGIVPVLLDPGIKEHMALVLFAIVMIFMGLGFGYVSRALSKMSGAPSGK